MTVTIKATIDMEYELRDGQSMEELVVEVEDQIRSGEYFPSHVMDVSILDTAKTA